ncbi:MAG: hypothetical protein H6965_11995 [Chromatiaceae bacterium]|nr:hypothetical protein [Chromatiaceae bacterium]
MITRIPSVIQKFVQAQKESVHPAQRPGKRFSRCLLHIGTEKTGTSTIQRFLALNRKSLLKKDILYPEATGKSGGSQWSFVACAKEMPWKHDVGRALGIRSADDLAKFQASFREVLDQEFTAAARADVLLLSSEHFHSRLVSSEEIAQLRYFLEPWVDRFEVILYLRRQDRVAVSFYSTKIKSGEENPVLFPLARNQGLVYYFDYEQIYQNWSKVFGKEAMQVRLFAKEELEQGDLLTDFCKVAGIEMKGKVVPPIENASLNKRGADFLMEVNRQLPKFIGGKRNTERDKLVEFIASLSHGRYCPATREQALGFYRRYEEGNRRLQERLFPGRSAPLFDDDFSDYPERVAVQPPSYEGAVALAIKIWKSRHQH